MFKEFFGGTHPPQQKNNTNDRPIKPANTPKRLILPLSQHTGRPSEPLVKPGDVVLAGTKIAKATGFISSNLHSPVSGKVLSIEQAPHPVLGRCLAIIIESNNAGTGRDLSLQDVNIDKLSPEQIMQLITDAGIVGLGGAAFPTHAKLSVPKEKKIDTIIINGAECEPYLTCDYRLMVEHPGEILKGIEIITKALGVKNYIVGIEDNKPDAIKAMKNVVVLPSKYPQGSEKQLIKTLLNREVPSGGLPFDAGVIVHNVATAFAIYEAVALNKPLYERVITASGDCLKDPGNLLVKIGITAADLVKECGGFVKDPKKIIFGGPMMGFSQSGLDTPLIKGTSGVLFLSKDSALDVKESVCIRCGACLRACPAGLEPTNIYYASQKSLAQPLAWPPGQAGQARIDLIKGYGALDCIECGACSFDCPAKLELAGTIKYAKLVIARSPACPGQAREGATKQSP